MNNSSLTDVAPCGTAKLNNEDAICKLRETINALLKLPYGRLVITKHDDVFSTELTKKERFQI